MSETTMALPAAHRPGWGAWVQLFLAEARMVTRDTSGLIIPIGMPILLLVMNGLNQDGDQMLPGGSTVMNAIMAPLTLTMIVALVGVVNMPSFLATYRKYGILRRLAVTPVRPVMMMLSQMAVSLVQVLVGIALTLGIGALFFGVTAPKNFAWALLVGVMLVAAMYAIGIFIAAVAPTVNAALALGLVAFFAMLALGGGFGPTANLPGVLVILGEGMPFGAGNQALSAAWIGEQPQIAHLITLTAWSVTFGGLAARFFRWT